jgi:hypothetical protein
LEEQAAFIDWWDEAMDEAIERLKGDETIGNLVADLLRSFFRPAKTACRSG